ncbi:MAG: OmpA family protein [Flavobacteriaceae bacterium]|nr:OmpA family protein [Flavobacteriaceae bacterium]
MKKFNLVLTLAFALLFSASANAQDGNNPWGISVGAHAVDYTSVRGMFDGFFDYDDYTIVPPLSKISIIRHLGGKFAADITASVGEVDNKRFWLKDELFINAGLGLRYRLLGTADNSYWFDPYVRVGASYNKYDFSSVSISADNPRMVAQRTGFDDGGIYPDHDFVYGDFEGEKGYFMVQGGLGINFWLTDHFGINLASDFNGAPSVDSDYVNFFQHTAGVTFKFGMKDRDKDGIPDDEDECPDTWGLKEFNGCPDSDGDGIRDLDDACPDVPGLPEFDGCPDTDGDGVGDNVDRCPNEPGPAENQGCPWPDTDGDGLTDNIDECPNQAGPRENNGCPWPDTDGDGIPDHLDRCPNEAGVAPDGCPEASVMVENINVGFVVEFDYNKATIRETSQPRIAEKAAQIKRALEIYPNMTLYIDGHTDDRGSASYNKTLSQKRAASVVKSLETNGVAAGALTPRGLGEEVPKCTNDTDEGRQCNRRVEVTIKSTGNKTN